MESPVAGVLDPDHIAWIGQHAQRHVDGLVNAFGDKDLVGVALDRTRHAQVIGQRLAKRQVAAAVRVGEQLWWGPAPQPGQDAAEGAVGKLRDVGHTGHERAPLPRAGGHIREQGLPPF